MAEEWQKYKYIPSSSLLLHSPSTSSFFHFIFRFFLSPPKTIQQNWIQIWMLPELDPVKPHTVLVAAGHRSGDL